MSKRAMRKVLVLYDSWPIWVSLDADLMSYIIGMVSRITINFRQWLCPISIIRRDWLIFQSLWQITKSNPLKISPKSLLKSRTIWMSLAISLYNKWHKAVAFLGFRFGSLRLGAFFTYCLAISTPAFQTNSSACYLSSEDLFPSSDCYPFPPQALGSRLLILIIQINQSDLIIR